jgi:stage V sporulation protein G
VEISEVKVKLMGDRTDRLKAFCSVTIDREFVIRDLKIIEGTSGMFVAMPSRKITDKCPACSGKNHLRAKFCNECGSRLNESRAGRDAEGRTKLHADIAHPINSGCRDRMQKKIMKSYEEEQERAMQPGYRPVYDEDFDDVDFIEGDGSAGAGARRSAPRHEQPAQEQAMQVPPPEPKVDQAQGDSFGAGIF